jgi:biotin carboxylase
MRVLVVSQLNWLGPARIPRALKLSGCEVGMVCPHGNLAESTSFVDRYFFYQSNSHEGWTADLARAIESFRPHLILPGMETVVYYLHQIWHAASAGQIENFSDEAAAAVRRSIFDPEKMSLFESKIELTHVLASQGVLIPPTKELLTILDAEAFVSEQGYPVIIKPAFGSGGVGAVVCRNEEELLEAMDARLRKSSGPKWMIQKFISGRTAMEQFAAGDGKILCRYSLDRLLVDPHPMGPSTVVRLTQNAEMEAAAHTFAELMGYNGLGSMQFAISDEDGKAYFYEANMRMGVSKHLGHVFGPDLAKALFEYGHGRKYVPERSNLGVTIALYPQEAIRDPQSPYLVDLSDKPADDPSLLAALEAHVATKRARLAGVLN